ncbi:MAG: hydantoinase B/oxoprolinase family protein [Albidovulum sp.]|nr:hydantoinase B/oxoprolinase family protein [Albidovulum sp.]MDE0532223.1 hydantoinase B/oxoprolinase family protein [Albidovulum sp.]
MPSKDVFIYRAASQREAPPADTDPVTTEVVRHSLNSAANHIKRTLVRTAFSPVIYEVLDFASAIYDVHLRLLAQAPSLPLFMGTMNFCVEAAVKCAGGVDALEPGDILLHTDPYGTGSHPQDAAVILPVFLNDEILVGYTAIKGHWLDIGGKEPYSTDTVDVFQEGTIYPGLKIYKRGQRDEELFRMIMSNTRVPKMVAGDINAQVAGVLAGKRELLRVVERYGLEKFHECVEAMFDHGEAIVRQYFEKIPDGRYVGQGEMDNNGVDEHRVPFEVTVEVNGSTVRVDYSNTPDAQPGPINCPLPSTVSASRVAISMLAGGGEAPCEGHFRPIEVATRPGSMFHPSSPSPCFLYGWPALQSIEVIYNAISKAMPEAVPACSGGDLAALVWWGVREKTGEPWADGSPHPVGAGAHIGGDGATMMHAAEAATRFSATEIWEAKNPWLLERVEFSPDSCGAGRYRSGLGVDLHFFMFEDAYVTSAIERSFNQPWGLHGGKSGRANSARLRFADGSYGESFAKATRLKVPKGSTLELFTGGGGGYGPAAERAVEAVEADLREGYITEAHAREHYPHALE